MRAYRLIVFLAALALTGLGLTGAASAQATRTWVSGVGDDVNPCSRTAPCKTFAGAISKTAAGGEIDCLDPGGFGGVTITKAITLQCDIAANGGVLVAATNAITVNAGPNDQIVLRGLDIEGVSGNSVAIGGLNAINFLAGKSLTVQKTNIRNFVQNGINFAPSGASQLNVVDTMINNAGASATFAGIQIRPTGTGAAKVDIEKTQVFGGLFGIVADGSATTGKISGGVRDSIVSNNGQNGITVSNGTAANITLLIDNVLVSGNGNNGLVANGANAGMLVGRTSVIGNGGGLFTSNGGALVSYGTNQVNGNNGNDGAFSSTTSMK
ncbi:right-handed parallel beta-helix repeat-containing protein [Methylosinus sp. H3A]|uniref:right-handed parallel beta-helix repeat-containing protein n=1 Tax=Methylosinus sp. H3A TaxID=2785786 RepID=UPI0018C1FF75|nr:right-handed parallel beta-helix repeat-containing protein [Methylosinus sp. H3A]MBG0812478.1 right-handed parallel beta-helix repeat-containing protein [Methylosinus sp. H3A]